MESFKDRKMEKLKKLQAAYAKCVADMSALMDSAGEDAMSADDQTKFDALSAQEQSLTNQIKNCEKFVKAKAEADRHAAAPGGPSLSRQIDVAGDISGSDINNNADVNNHTASTPIIIPARAMRFAGNLRSFSGPTAVEDAYSAGQWFRAIVGVDSARTWCADHGMPVEMANSQVEGVNADGGYLVPLVLETRIIRLVESFGMFRQKARIQPMTSETSSTNRRTGGVTSTFTGETQAATKSKMTWDQVNLIAKKLTALTCMSDEVNADTIVSVADQLIEEIALAHATKEDQSGFNGDGTSTYGGIVGIRTKLVTINGVDDGGGLVLADGNQWIDITLANMEKVMGATINLANAREEWYCSKPFWAQVMVKLQKAAGGATPSDISDAGSRNFLGFTVNVSNSFPKTEANSQVPCIFGDLNLSSTFGDRMGQTISISRDATIDGVNMFETGQVAIKGVERFDINNHDLGDATDGGPVVGLILAAS